MPTQAILTPGARRLSNTSGGVHATLHGQLVMADGSAQIGYIKLLPQRRLINELLANQLAKSLGFSVPDAFVVLVPSRHYQALFAELQIQDKDVVAFGSSQAPGQMLAQAFDFSDAHVMSRFVTSNKCWQAVAHFDCLVANTDRHLKNVVFDPLARFWLIDHDQAFGQELSVDALNPLQPSLNRLLNIFEGALSLRLKHELVDTALKFEALTAVLDMSHVAYLSWISAFATTPEVEALVLYLEQRRALIGQLLAAQVGVQLLPFLP